MSRVIRTIWVLVLLLSVALLSQDQPPKKEGEVGEAVVLSLEGDVEFRRPKDTKKWAKLVKDAKLQGGDQIQTGLKSKCLLKVGEATRVLIRPSSFATLTRAFVEKNKVDAEVRVDVGSVFIDVDRKVPEKVDFKVSTPVGTASIRGTGLLVIVNEFGAQFFQSHGEIIAHGGQHPDTPIDDSMNQLEFPGLMSGDLWILKGEGHNPSFDGLLPSLDNAVNSIVVDQAIHGPQDFTQQSQTIGGSPDAAPVTTGTDNTYYVASQTVKWSLQYFTFGLTGNFNVVPLSPIAGVRQVAGNPTDYFGTVRGTDVFSLINLGSCSSDWHLTNLANNRMFKWDDVNKIWIPQ
jgi:hypothetical protein